MGLERIIGRVVNTSSSGAATAECDVVSNIEVAELDNGATLQITWDEPACGDCISKYAVYVDSTKVGDTIVPVYVHEGVSPTTTYNIEVRAINKVGEECSGVSVSYTTGSFPALDPFIIPHYKAATLVWAFLGDMPGYTIEGYNVYYHNGSSFVKQNGSLLSLTTDTYLKTGLALSEEVRMAVSFEYNSGTESSLFEATETLPGIPGGDYIITIKNSYIPSPKNGKFPLVAVGRIPTIMRGGWKSLGIGILKEGSASIGWGSPSSGTANINGLATRKYRFVSLNSTEGETSFAARIGTSKSNYKYRLQIGCRSQDGMIFKGGSKRRLTVSEGILYGGIWRDTRAFLFTGYCPAHTNNDIGVAFTVHVDPDSLLGVGVPPANWTNYSITEVYNPMNPTASVSGGNDVTVSWPSQAGVQGYNVYFKEDGESSYTKQNSSLIKQTSYAVNDVPAGNYTVAVTMVYLNYESIIDDNLTKDTFTTS